MIKAVELENAIRTMWLKPIERPKDTFGCSEGGFCKEKLVLKARLDTQYKVTGNMVIGKIFHKELTSIMDNTIYAKMHGLKFWEKPKFEKLAKYQDERGFAIEGHVDCDLPAADRIIELKTTATKKEYTTDDFITRAYLMQANAYACILGRKHYEIWFIYKNFTDLENQRFISVMEGEADPELFKEFLDNIFLIYMAIKQEKDLMGPEASWECKYCTYVDQCPHWEKELKRWARLVPADKKSLTSNDKDEKCFKLQYDRGLIKYSRETKKYVWKTEADDDIVEVKEESG